MLKKLSAIATGMLIAVVAFAADVELNKDHPDTYVVQKGDTLWGIAGRFLTKPWLWPEIWQANPQVKNPHLIYPGDRLSLVYLDGRPILNVNGQPAFGPHVREEPLGDAITGVPLGEVRPFLEKARVFDQGETEKLPYVVGLEETHILAQSGQVAYVRGLQATPGTRVVFLRPTNDYTEVPLDFPWKNSRRGVEVESWEQSEDLGKSGSNWWKQVAVNHIKKRHSEFLGREAIEIGNGEVLRNGDPATVLIRYQDREITKGDLIAAGDNQPFDLTFYPHEPKKVPENMRVMAVGPSPFTAGPHEIVALSRGTRDGVENGQVYAVYRPGDRIRDDVKYPEGDARAVFQPGKAKVTLPEEFAGNVMIFRTFDKMSYGLIMDGIKPVQAYYVLHEPTN